MLKNIAIDLQTKKHDKQFITLYHKRILFLLQLTFIPIKIKYVYTIMTQNVFILSQQLQNTKRTINILHISTLITFYKEKLEKSFSSRVNWKAYKTYFIPLAYLHDIYIRQSTNFHLKKLAHFTTPFHPNMLSQTNLIYTVYSLNNITLTYVGMTTKTLIHRWTQHITKARSINKTKEKSSRQKLYTTTHRMMVHSWTITIITKKPSRPFQN